MALQHDIRRLYVAVDHAVLMGMLQGKGEVGDQFGALGEGGT